MNVSEFLDRYYLHDSTIRHISYDKKSQELIFNVDFSFWMQDWFDQNHFNNGMVNIRFSSVQDYDGLTGEIDWFSFLNVYGNKDGSMTMIILDDFNNVHYVWTFTPSSITFEDLLERTD